MFRILEWSKPIKILVVKGIVKSKGLWSPSFVSMEAKMKLEKEKDVTDYSSLLRFICFETETCEAL